jgi:hypothetical protein
MSAELFFIKSLALSVTALAVSAHRPLGSVNPARLHAYTVFSAKRRGKLGIPQREPSSGDTFRLEAKEIT